MGWVGWGGVDGCLGGYRCCAHAGVSVKRRGNLEAVVEAVE